MKIAVTGASGLIGRALVTALLRDGHEVLRLVRRSASSADEVSWDPMSQTVDRDGLAGTDAFVNLAGAGVAARPWTASYKQTILDSRVKGTTTIARTAASLDPKPRVVVSASAIGYYGDTGPTAVDETAPAGEGFLADVVQQWEAAAAPAADSGVRVVHPRTGIVVAAHGGAWGRLLPLFRAGLGGRLGSGEQYWSFVSLRDEVAALRRMIDDDTMVGAYNVTAPNPATNRAVTEVMGRALHRPTFANVPEFVLKTALGQLSHEVLGSLRVLPARLQEAGFSFLDPTFEMALNTALSDRTDQGRG